MLEVNKFVPTVNPKILENNEEYTSKQIIQELTMTRSYAR